MDAERVNELLGVKVLRSWSKDPALGVDGIVHAVRSKESRWRWDP
jgi:hypothetical protein